MENRGGNEWYLPLVDEGDDIDLFVKLRRDNRKIDALRFRRQYIYGRSKDKKTCVWPGGGHCSWLDDSSGVTWVGVHGNDCICVVTKARDLDVTRVRGFAIFLTKEQVLRPFRSTLISEIEDIADPSIKLHERPVQSIKEPFGADIADPTSEVHERPVQSIKPPLGADIADPTSEVHERPVQSIKPPFGVVSVEGGHERGHESSSDDYKEDEFFNLFLEEFNRQAASDECESDDYEIEEDVIDRDSFIKCLVKREVKKERSLLVDVKKTIKFQQEEMKRVETITINETVEETSDDETTSDNDDVKKAIEFLQDKMKTADDFTSEETIQIAISAFQQLFKKKFNADDIGVCVLDVKDPVESDMYAKELDKSEIKHHLAEIYAPGSVGSVEDSVNSDIHVKELKRIEIQDRIAEAEERGGSKKRRLDYHL